MTTSHTQTRLPLRLNLADHIGRDSLDGGWWPQTRDLTVELPDLIEHLPPGLGRILRVVFSPPDWESAPRRISVAGRFVKTGSFPEDDSHLVDLRMSDHNVLRLLVIPPAMTDDQGDEAMLAATTAGYTYSAAELLDTVSELPDVDPANLWTVELSEPSSGSRPGPR
jgi:hypothetical protein